MSVLSLSATLGAVNACTRTTDRVIEPVGAGDASTTTPTVEDAGLMPVGPIAHPVEPAEDFRLVRAPEFGLAQDMHRAAREYQGVPGLGGGAGFSGNAGTGGADRPVAGGGSNF